LSLLVFPLIFCWAEVLLCCCTHPGVKCHDLFLPTIISHSLEALGHTPCNLAHSNVQCDQVELFPLPCLASPCQWQSSSCCWCCYILCGGTMESGTWCLALSKYHDRIKHSSCKAARWVIKFLTKLTCSVAASVLLHFFIIMFHGFNEKHPW